MVVDPRYVEGLVRLLAFIGGTATTVVGSWISSKIHVYHENRKAYLEDIKQRVLSPIRARLDENFGPIISGQKPIVFACQGAREFFEKANVTEEQTEQGEFLAAAFPGHSVFGAVDSALLRDAGKNHFRELMKQVYTLVSHCAAYGGECHTWTNEMALTILARSGFDAFPTRPPGLGPQFYVMHNRLAVFVFKGLFGMAAPALRIEAIGQHCGLHGETATLAFGEKQQQIGNLVGELNKLIESEANHARTLRQKLSRLQESYNALIAELDLAIAARRLHKRCDLVRFF